MSIVSRDYRVPSGRPGLNVLLRNKHQVPGGRPLLFVHGATYPSTVMFDYPIAGESWMDWMAMRGFDCWCIDLLGYGGADRPSEMAEAAGANAPIVDTAEAVRDVRLAIDFILAERDVPHLDLLGYSWGTAIAGQIAGEVPDKIERLVLGGALWTNLARVEITLDGDLGAYRLVEAAATVKRWLVGLDAQQQAMIAPIERLQAWSQAAVASDPESTHHQPPRLRAPCGVVKDVQQYWMQAVATYDPAAIRAPVLIVVGEWDHETTPAQGLALFEQLANASQRRYTIIGAATHSMLLENQRHQLYATVHEFLVSN